MFVIYSINISVCVCNLRDYLKLPEDAACVSVVVVSQRYVFHSTVAFVQVTLHMFEEPGFEMQPNSVYLE